MIEMIKMVGVAQLVEHWVVAPVVAGSSPVTHPSEIYANKGMYAPFFCSWLPLCHPPKLIILSKYIASGQD
jgi:hypothetical protein